MINWRRHLTSFFFLNVTQFLGAMLDNIFKLLIIFFFIQQEGIENSPKILSTAGAIFVLPFLLFSSTAGTLADKYSKSRIIITTKLLEIVIMFLGLIAFIYGSKWGSYGVLFLLAAQSALFSPSKYGILPQLMPEEKISQANGWMTSCTYLAIIFGTFFASFLMDITGRNYTVAVIFCIFLSLLGVIASCCIEYTKPSGSRKQLNVQFISEIYKTLKKVRTQPSLIAAILGSAFFLFLAAYVQLNIIPFGVESLHLTDVQGGYLFLLTAIGIGTGSALAGKISGRSVELALVPLAICGITVCFFLLDLFSENFYLSIVLIMTIGLFGGLYLIPLDSYIQIASPKKFIGSAVAASTFLSFIGVLCASVLLFVVSEMLGFKADKGFTILGFLTLIATVIYGFLFFDYLTRFTGMILSKLHFKTNFQGQGNIPTNHPAVFVCTHTDWNDTLLMLGAQRRRIRFFIEKEQEHSKFLLKAYRMLRVVMIPEIEPIEDNTEFLNVIKKTLRKGISVCLFVDTLDIDKEFEKLKQATLLQEILKKKQYPMILVRIKKGEKNKKAWFFTRLINKIRVPAAISFETVSVGKYSDLGSEEEDPYIIPNISLKKESLESNIGECM